MADICGNKHPDYEQPCGLDFGNHRLHTNYLGQSWPNEMFREPRSPRPKGKAGRIQAEDDLRNKAKEIEGGLSDPGASQVALHSNPQATERIAAYSNLPRSGTDRRTILMAFAHRGDDGYTHHEVGEATDIYHYTAAPRCTELHQGGWLEDSGRTRPGKGGSPSIVWVLTAEGRKRLVAEGTLASGSLQDFG